MTIEEELETTGETVIQEETPTGEIQGTAQPVATTTQKPDDYDDPDDDVDPSISRKILIKKIIKFTLLITISGVLAYKLFIQGDNTDNEGDSANLNNATTNTPATDYIPSNLPSGNIVSKEEAKSIIHAPAPMPSIAPRIPTLEPPNLPDLPDFNTFNQAPGAISPATNDVNKQPGVPSANGGEISEEQKRKFSMFVLHGDGNTSASHTPSKKKVSDFIILDGSRLSPKIVSEKISTNIVTNLDTSLIQGKIIDAVLETAINSELPGLVRALVSSDVFGEIGNKILIPRGSRIFGSYSNTTVRGQSRINISWTRISRPDGVTISINAQATDQFGRAGVEGDVDNRFSESLTNSLFVTFASLGAALALDKISNNQGQSQIVSPNGTFTTTGVNATNVAAQAAIQQVTNMTNKIFQGTNFNPVVSLPQGTKLKVVVAQDLVIPPFRRVATPG